MRLKIDAGNLRSVCAPTSTVVLYTWQCDDWGRGRPSFSFGEKLRGLAPGIDEQPSG